MVCACTAALPAGAAIRAAAIGSPGVIDQAAKTVCLAPQLPGWEGLKPAEALLGTDPGYPVATENEMQLAVLGEQRWGAARGAADVVYVGLGVGVGAGILLDGQLHRGFRGAAGEIGYLPIPGPLAAPADDRTPGAFERAVGAYGWQHRGDELGLGSAARSMPSQAGHLEIFAAARTGDKAALQLIEEISEILARGIASVCLLLDPQMVIMGGGLSGAGPVLFDPLRERTARLIPGDPVPIIPSQLGDEAVVLGAVRRAVELSDELLYNSELGPQET